MTDQTDAGELMAQVCDIMDEHAIRAKKTMTPIREAFNAWNGDAPEEDTDQFAWEVWQEAWQASAAQQSATIEDMRRVIEQMAKEMQGVMALNRGAGYSILNDECSGALAAAQPYLTSAQEDK